MSLNEYRRKRNFRKTPEPRGKRAARHRELSFVIQKHDASHLHYDFRLEWDGVLKSWAVPKGPDLDPANKRLAMLVEDHPLEYGDFEGIIPQGEYGGGTVMIWDRGTWTPVGDAEEGLREGRLKFSLNGEKLRGNWMLVRKGGVKATEERTWFLFKERDDFAQTGGRPVTEKLPRSVTTERSLDEIAKESDRVWGPEGEVSKNGRAKKGRATTTRRTSRPTKTVSERRSTTGRFQAKLKKLLDAPGVREAKLPRTQKVKLATLVQDAPEGDQWLHEMKFDGYRMLARLENGQVRFISRNGNNWTDDFPELADAVRSLPLETAMLDGEVVALQSDGTTSFQALQNAFRGGRTGELVYYLFDILHVNGFDVTELSLEKRKEILKTIVSASRGNTIRFSDHVQGTGPEFAREACKMHLEGIISKRRDSKYSAGRNLDWLKFKCSRREEFVIGGFTPPSGTRRHFGAILLGYYTDDGRLMYAGRVGSGFDAKTLESLNSTLISMKRDRSPFANLSGTRGQAKDVTWTEPKLVAEVEFSNWSNEGIIRHPSFQGLREDKDASDVRRDEPISLDAVSQEKAKGKAPATRKRETKQSGTRELLGVRFSNFNKVLYPDDGITKGNLADYYVQVAKWMLPHVADRPLALLRCPNGIGKPCFFQKHPGEGGFELLRQVNVSETNTEEINLIIDDASALLAVVQMGTLEIHTWGSKAKHLEKPDRLTFDLDPDPAVAWPRVVAAAKEIRLVLEEFGLESFLKTTGGKGLHIVVPIRPHLEWDDVKEFCSDIADAIVRAAPHHYTANMSKAARKGKIYIDYLRNRRGATAIAPYSTRNKPGATVSVPIAWDELGPQLHSDDYTIQNVPARLKHLKSDPWKSIDKTKQTITAAMRKSLKSLLSHR